MISEPKRITVHGVATHYSLLAFKFSGKDDRVIEHAGYGDGDREYLAILRLCPDPELFLDSPGGRASWATKSSCYVLNGAVQVILDQFDSLPREAHIEVSSHKKVVLTEGVRFL